MSKNSTQVMQRVSQWCYQGVWAIITRWFKVPADPPSLIGADDKNSKSFRPSEGFLRYLKFQFWILLAIIDIALVIVWLVILFTAPVYVSLLITLPMWALIILPDIFAYVAIHLRYDTTWYLLSDRSMRIRRESGSSMRRPSPTKTFRT